MKLVNARDPSCRFLEGEEVGVDAGVDATLLGEVGGAVEVAVLVAEGAVAFAL